jgi:hypothetical protein
VSTSRGGLLAGLTAVLIGAGLAAQSALPRGAPERQGGSSAGTGIDAMHSSMLVRHGYVVAEGWWNPYTDRSGIPRGR